MCISSLKLPIKRAVIVSNSCSVGGGSSKVAIETAKILAAHTNWEVCLFCGFSASESEEELKKLGVRIVSMRRNPYLECVSVHSALAGLYDSSSAKAFSRLLNEGNPATTIVHFHSWLHTLSPSLFFAAARFGAPVCVTAHEYFSICPNGGLFDYNQLEKCRKKALSPSCLLCNCDKRSYVQKVYRCVRHLIQVRGFRAAKASFFAISTINRTLLEQHAVLGGVRGMLLNPIDVSAVSPIPCKLKKDSFFLYVGRLDVEKGIELLCEAARRANAKLVVVGDGPLMPQLREAYPEIRYEGWKNFNEIAGYYLMARAVVIPSLLYETSSLVVLEAKALGAAPFVVPTECASGEYIQDGIDGLVFESGDVASLSSALQALEDDELLARLRTAQFHLEGRTAEDYFAALCAAYREAVNRMNLGGDAR